MNSKWKEASEIKELAEAYTKAKPFPHIVVEDFLEAKQAEKLHADFPALDSPLWVFRYKNPIEFKLASDHLSANLPGSLTGLLEYLNSKEVVDWVAQITGIPDLRPDPYYHGAGLHCHPRGGKLDLHLDYSIHPRSGFERRVNLIVYLNKDWKPEYGGDIELWDADFTQCVTKVAPAFNRMVMFQTSDQSYHGVPDLIQCPEDMARKSVAVYYLSDPRTNVTHRHKAQFRGRPSEPPSELLARLRQIRSERRLEPEDLKDWPEEQARLAKLGCLLPL